MIPIQIPISILIKFKDILSIDDLISFDKQHRILSSFNIYSCSISIINSTHHYLSTIPVLTSNVDFIISDIIWNDHFHLNDDISWVQLEFNRRISSMASYIFDYKIPLFICDCQLFQVFTFTSPSFNSIPYSVNYHFKNSNFSYFNASKSARGNLDILHFALTHASSEHDCYLITLFLSNHAFISNDYISLFPFYNKFPPQFLVITDPSFRFKHKAFSYITNNSISVSIPPISLFIPFHSISLNTVHYLLFKFFGFNPIILYLAVNTIYNDLPDYHQIIVIFDTHISTYHSKNIYLKAFNSSIYSSCIDQIFWIKPY